MDFKIILTIGSSILLLLGNAGLAAPPQGSHTHIEHATANNDISIEDDRLAEAIRQHFGFHTQGSDIASLRHDNMGYGEISIAHGLAHLSGRPLRQILDMRSRHMGWGRIAHELGVKVSDAVHHSRVPLQQARLDYHSSRVEYIFNSPDGHDHEGKNPAHGQDKARDNPATNQDDNDPPADHTKAKGEGKSK